MRITPYATDPKPNPAIRPEPAGKDRPSGAGRPDSVSPENPGIPQNAYSDRQNAIGIQVQRKEALNRATRRYRHAGQAIHMAEQAVERMKRSLTRIIKNFPPFPPGSEERIRMLKAYVSFRKQIEAMTIPPEASLPALPEIDETATDSTVSDALSTIEQVRYRLSEGFSKLEEHFLSEMDLPGDRWTMDADPVTLSRRIRDSLSEGIAGGLVADAGMLRSI